MNSADPHLRHRRRRAVRPSGNASYRMGEARAVPAKGGAPATDGNDAGLLETSSSFTILRTTSPYTEHAVYGRLAKEPPADTERRGLVAATPVVAR
jgi:hypothetical protein